MKCLLKCCILVFSVLFLTSSCVKNKIEFVLTSTKVEGLKPSTGIYYEKLKIGSVDQVKAITNDSSVLECHLIFDLQIPTDSKFYSNATDADTVIMVLLGNSNEAIQTGAIYPLIVEEKSLLDSVGSKIIDFIEQLSGAGKQDSICKNSENLIKI
jgi:hypothetical protein